MENDLQKDEVDEQIELVIEEIKTEATETPVKKIRKPQSEAQKNNLIKARITRAENQKQVREIKEATQEKIQEVKKKKIGVKIVERVIAPVIVEPVVLEVQKKIRKARGPNKPKEQVAEKYNEPVYQQYYQEPNYKISFH
jgi:hypothetical protein